MHIIKDTSHLYPSSWHRIPQTLITSWLECLLWFIRGPFHPHQNLANEVGPGIVSREGGWPCQKDPTHTSDPLSNPRRGERKEASSVMYQWCNKIPVKLGTQKLGGFPGREHTDVPGGDVSQFPGVWGQDFCSGPSRSLLMAMPAAQLCPTLCDPKGCNLPGSSVHGILQARILEWVATSSSRGSSRPRAQTCVSCIARQILYHCTTWEALHLAGPPDLYLKG